MSPPSGPPPRGFGPQRSALTRWQKTFMWIGVIGGWLTGFLWGILATLSYFGWKNGRKATPTFAIFWGILVAVLVPILTIASLTSSQ